MIRRLALWLLLAGLPGLAAAAVTPLGANDVAALLTPPAHGTRIVALWSLDCAYCEPNLRALAQLRDAHPDAIELVLVATDGPAQQTAVEARLKAMHLDAEPARLYADASPERLDWLLDADWGGELPRTLILRADGSRQGISGALDTKHLARLP